MILGIQRTVLSTIILCAFLSRMGAGQGPVLPDLPVEIWILVSHEAPSPIIALQFLVMISSGNRDLKKTLSDEKLGDVVLAYPISKSDDQSDSLLRRLIIRGHDKFLAVLLRQFREGAVHQAPYRRYRDDLNDELTGAKLPVSGEAPLMCAARNKQLQCARVLVEQGVLILPRNYKGENALNVALVHDGAIAKYFIEQLNADEKALDEMTFPYLGTESIVPLMAFAAQHGQTDVIKYLKQKGCDIERPNPSNGSTPIKFAAQFGHLETFDALLELGAQRTVNNQGWTALMYAAYNDQALAVKRCAELGDPVDAKNHRGESALLIATQSGSINAARALLELGASLEETDNGGKRSAFIVALELQLQGFQSLYLTNSKRDAKSLDKLIIAHMPLACYVAKGKDPEIIDLLHAKGCNLDEQDDTNGNTPILCAAENRLVMVEKLISCGANVFARNYENETAIMRAARAGLLNIVKKFADLGVNVDEKSACRGRTALHFALLYGHLDITRELVARGANVDEYDQDGRSALHYAFDTTHLLR